ncbi:hypothetical protein ACP70R_032732 [Stipagrostis hirtigluma subsp. patula]
MQGLPPHRRGEGDGGVLPPVAGGNLPPGAAGALPPGGGKMHRISPHGRGEGGGGALPPGAGGLMPPGAGGSFPTGTAGVLPPGGGRAFPRGGSDVLHPGGGGAFPRGGVGAILPGGFGAIPPVGGGAFLPGGALFHGSGGGLVLPPGDGSGSYCFFAPGLVPQGGSAGLVPHGGAFVSQSIGWPTFGSRASDVSSSAHAQSAAGTSYLDLMASLSCTGAAPQSSFMPSQLDKVQDEVGIGSEEPLEAPSTDWWSDAGDGYRTDVEDEFVTHSCESDSGEESEHSQLEGEVSNTPCSGGTTERLVDKQADASIDIADGQTSHGECHYHAAADDITQPRSEHELNDSTPAPGVQAGFVGQGAQDSQNKQHPPTMHEIHVGYSSAEELPNRSDCGPVEEAMRKPRKPNEDIFVPYEGQTFPSLPDAYQFYNLYSWELGFSIRRGTNQDGPKKEDGTRDRNMQEYRCQRSGIPKKRKRSTTSAGMDSQAPAHPDLVAQHAVIAVNVAQQGGAFSEGYGDSDDIHELTDSGGGASFGPHVPDDHAPVPAPACLQAPLLVEEGFGDTDNLEDGPLDELAEGDALSVSNFEGYYDGAALDIRRRRFYPFQLVKRPRILP